MNLDYLDKMIPKKWLLLVCYYLPFCYFLPFYIKPSILYFKCRAFIDKLKLTRQKNFPLAQLPDFLRLLQKNSVSVTEIKLANQIVSEILIKESKKISLNLLISIFAQFDPENKKTHSYIINNVLRHIPTKFYTEYLRNLNVTRCCLLDLRWCVRYKSKFKLEDRLNLILSLSDKKIIDYRMTLFELGIQECEEKLLNNKCGLHKFLSAYAIEQLLKFIFTRHPTLIFSNRFIYTLICQLLETQDPLLTSRILDLNVADRINFFENFLVGSKNFRSIAPLFLSLCQKDRWSEMIDHLIACVFSIQEATEKEALQVKKLTGISWKTFLLTQLEKGNYPLNLFQRLAIQALSKKPLDLEKLKNIVNIESSLETRKYFSTACQVSVAEANISEIKLTMQKKFMVHIRKENIRRDIHHVFNQFFNNENSGKLPSFNLLILEKLPEHLQMHNENEVDLNFLQQLLSQLCSMLGDPALIDYKIKRSQERIKVEQKDMEKNEARRELKQRIKEGTQSSISFQRMQELFGADAQTMQEAWKKKGIHFFDADDKQECKLAYQDADKIIQFKREYNDHLSCLSTSPSTASYFYNPS